MNRDPRRLPERARELRNNPTHAEKKFWSRVRRKELDGRKFRRQHILEPYIVDFYCVSEALVVEIDGRSHDSEEKAEQDRRRDEFLEEEYEVRVVRFTDTEVFRNIERVLAEVRGTWRDEEA